MFFAIKTKLMPATDTRGTLIKAAVVGESGQCGRPATISYDYALSTKENHSAALAALRVIYGIPLRSEFVGSTACGRGEMIHLYRTTAA
jgi:hypothetical protein